MNQKISLYLPQRLYDRFKKFQTERNLSASAAGMIILSEYFGVNNTTVDGITLSKIEELETRLSKLEVEISSQKLIERENKSSIIRVQRAYPKTKQLTLLEEFERAEIIITQAVLSRRLEIKNPKTITNKRKEFYQDKDIMVGAKDFSDWSKTKDPNGIGWQPIQGSEGTICYTPSVDLSEQLRDTLWQWIAQNE